MDHASTKPSTHTSSVECDRWLEIDLYWFDRHAKKSSVENFWIKYAPLLENVTGWKGVIVNVGWLLDYMLEWDGRLDGAVKFPKDMKTYPWFKDAGQLCGTTEERQEMYRARFANADEPQIVNYDAWTHADLKELVALLRKVAREEYRIDDLRVGSFVLGWKNIYAGEFSSFGQRHPNAFKDNFPNLIARLSADRVAYGAFAEGIPENTSFTEFFGKQWGHFSRTVGLDTIVLRDSLLGVGVYSRRGPYGKTAPEDPKKVEDWHLASGDLVRQTKTANPDALVIGYSSAASAIGDWRTNCFDLERIAREGFLDAWIDQTWGGAWNEVGQRPYSFWNGQLLGWTYQLAHVLVHAALLGESKVRHYVVNETFDAWESWDVIHTAPQRLRWGIWAFSHAAVKTPTGLKMPAGSYISWCNKGKELLSDADVAFLKKNCNEAFTDARATTEIFGPTLVYCRSALQWQSDHAPAVSIGEWIDEQSAAFSKWSIPVLSITRTEYLADVKSDLFVLQTPNHLGESEKRSILSHLKSGKPTLVVGRVAGGIDPEIASLIGISTEESSVGPIEFVGTLDGRTGPLFAELPNTFPLFQPFVRNRTRPENRTLYSVRSSPCFVFKNTDGLKILFWDPPDVATHVPKGEDFGVSLDQMLGSTVTFTIVARQLNELLRQQQSIHVAEITADSPVSYLAWRIHDGKYRLLTADLEEGVNHAGTQKREITVIIPEAWAPERYFEYTDLISGETTIKTDRRLEIKLRQAESLLYGF